MIKAHESMTLLVRETLERHEGLLRHLSPADQKILRSFYGIGESPLPLNELFILYNHNPVITYSEKGLDHMRVVALRKFGKLLKSIHGLGLPEFEIESYKIKRIKR